MTPLVLRPPIEQGGNCCFVRNLGDLFGRGSIVDPNDSRLFVFENGKPLGPPHTPVVLIESNGGGGFLHNKGMLYFSASDNSDPNTNGKTYSIALSDELYFAERYNYSRWQILGLCKDMQTSPEAFKGMRILEIGPGRDAGFALMMAGLGASTIGVEKYRSGWNKNWHGPFIDAICKYAPQDFSHFDPTPLRRCQKNDAFDPDHIGFYQTAMEDFSPTRYSGFDFSFSCAVLEHICDPALVLRNIYEASSSGSFGLHYIDFRDHRDFTAPLEFLLLDDAAFEAEVETREKYEFGNRLRYSSYLKLWQDTGFKVINHAPNMIIDEDYLQKTMPKLRTSSSRYKDASEEDLRAISGYFLVQRT